ncbi:UDP-glucose dehydrogenase family protein [Lederbergia wuyishanensis]|uniref:UDP-glucose 6-dehydrogenase n=1 Tax=Lederbergia wuyishanensis TaxID=1347903 RepID=A0ABU0D0I8_9BACI|nr:UDP-glucose/GDP-mannose dehydrogenase family protein [Lederbergia wuyishanensis]MCJ8006536.1 UDP-glucose/GDP-mannose dehydrogenase family protein [Lederbergia wuyishanensis]MDQ0341915.1 UDPglucose 6-dehydrogenase [Lederbergia wuyishanensis]
MKISVLGTGYVGLSTGVCLAEIGHFVTCIDINQHKIGQLCQGKSPIYEPFLENLLLKNADEGRLKFTSSYLNGLEGTDIIILAVGTPQSEDGSADLSYIMKCAKDIAPHLTDGVTVVIKSTVPVGTNELVEKIIMSHCNNDITINMASNPEFLRQGSAINDTLHPDRIIIGANSKKVADKIEEMYLPLKAPIIKTSIRSAELIKYASNAFLATKISYINQIANLCEMVGADVNDIALGMGTDKRIGLSFLQAGIGYGGSCFPKDVKALHLTAEKHGIQFSLLKETMRINDEQQELLVKKAKKRFGSLKSKKIALFGLSFKPNTDDMREAPSIKIVRLLSNEGANVVAYDPVATHNAREVLGNMISYANSPEEAILDADAVFIVTDWDEFKHLNITNILKKMRCPIIFDGRNCLDESMLHLLEIGEYYPVGRPSVIFSNQKSD